MTEYKLIDKNMLKLGTKVIDKSTNQGGMLTLMQLETNGNIYYYFQPRGTSPKTGEPLEGRWIVDTSIDNGVDVDPPYLPKEVLGTWAIDNASGYAGNITSIRLHINGCVHVSLQSTVILDDTGTVPLSVDFDIRRLSGEKINNLTEEELEESKLARPSPVSTQVYQPRF
jgi:hypothetical protein